MFENDPAENEKEYPDSFIKQTIEKPAFGTVLLLGY
jgi:hypothetical protein